MGFCDIAWQHIAAVRAAVRAHPFVTGLGDGSLPAERFVHYMQQDSLYLADYAKALALVAARAPDASARKEFAGGARVAVEVEEALHTRLIGEMGGNALLPVKASPACTGYAGYLVSLAATAPYEVAIAGLLPCFWIYADVGEALAQTCIPDNPYAGWIATYADPGFLAATARVKALVDAAASPAHEAAMLDAFVTASHFEWMFWDSAWQMSGWPLDSVASGRHKPSA
jgi:thiaminase (transcriptional activator TenA)